MRSRWVALVLALTALTSPGVARAGGSDAAIEEANEALVNGDFAAAAQHFDEAAAETPAASTYLAAAKAYKQAGDLGRAADRLAQALASPDLAARDKGTAQRQLKEYEKKLGLIALTGDPKVLASLDGGTPVRPEVTIHATPGEHVLELSGERGKAKKSVTVELGKSVTVELSVDMLPKPPPPPEPEPPPPPPKPKKPPTSTLRTIGFVGLGAGVVGAGVAIGVGVGALGAKDDFEASRTQADFDHASGMERTTNIVWVVAGGLAAAGTALVVLSYVAAPKVDAHAETSATLSVGPGGAALTGRF